MKRLTAFLLSVSLIVSFSGTALSLSRMGSVGKEVSDIQSVLKNKGYYSGNVDGIFGYATKIAVEQFQRDN